MSNGLNKKTIIQLVVIVVAFGAAGLVLYNGMFKSNNSASVATGSLSSSAQAAEEILPYGGSLNFQVLDPKRFQYNQITYQKLDPKAEVGISPDSLIVPPPVIVPGQ